MGFKSTIDPLLSSPVVSYNRWELGDINLGHVEATYLNFEGNTSSSKDEDVVIHFGLKGDYQFAHKQLNKSYDLIGGHHNIMYSKGRDLEIKNKSLHIETFGISIQKSKFLSLIGKDDDLVTKFTSDVANDTPCIFSETWGTITPMIQSIIDEIKLNTYQGPLQKIFLQAKTLELLVICIDNYYNIKDSNLKFVRTNQDKEAIITARDYVNDHVAHPPSLSQVARHVGINEYKLKNGFKEVFGCTMFSYLTERRLNLAMQILLITAKTAAEISFELGYSSPQHFNNQFRNKFGVTPNSVRQASKSTT